MAGRARFDEKTKLAALADLDAGMTLAEAAEKYGASVGSLQNWKKRYAAPAANGASPHGRLQEITQALAELENEKAAIQRQIRAEAAVPKIMKLLMSLDDKTLEKLEVVHPGLAEQARFIQDS